MLDYLVLGKEFGTGDMPYSESGKSHFADCKVLFDLNLGVLIASTAIIVILFALEKFKVINILSGSHKPWFYTGIISVIALTSIALLASADFEKAFEVFHYIFFPGKDNWAFNPFTDEIIYVLPQEFFMNCAILIGSAMVFGFAACISFANLCEIVFVLPRSTSYKACDLFFTESFSPISSASFRRSS